MRVFLLAFACVSVFFGCKKNSRETKTVSGTLFYFDPAADGSGGYYLIGDPTLSDSVILVDGYYQGHYGNRDAFEKYRGKKTQLVYTETGRTAQPSCMITPCPYLPVVTAVSFTVLP